MSDPPLPSSQMSNERNVSAVAGNGGGFTKKQGVVFIGGATALALAFILLRPQAGPNPRTQTQEDRLRVQAIGRYEPPPLPPPTPVSFPRPPPLVTPPVLPTQLSPIPGRAEPVDPLLKARHAPLFAYGSNSTNVGASQANRPGSSDPGQPAAGGQNELAERLQATPVNAVGATVLPHQPFLLTKGNILPCVLQTAMDSTLPGFVSCKLPNDVTGKTGITLLDRGSLIVGETHGGMQQGQNRLFVLWTRAETPSGVIINLDSPAADALGRTGMDGVVDEHFWSRLKGALLLSLVQSGLQAGTSSIGNNGYGTINTGSVQGLSSETLHNSLDISPTLRKNQGELVSIQVARDLDFFGVYKISVTR